MLLSSLGSVVVLGGTVWVTTTNARLVYLEDAMSSIGREVSELKASQLAMQETQRQIIVSLREIRDDVKILLRGK